MTKELIERSGIAPKLIKAVMEQLGEDAEQNLEDIARHGISGGFPGFTYYRDTVPFFKQNRAQIVKLVERMAEELGENPVEMVTNFSCLCGYVRPEKPETQEQRQERAQTRRNVARCLYGGRIQLNGKVNGDCLTANALAWFAAEEVARALTEV